MSLPRPLFLTGFMATGKSTVGALAASRAHVPFVDLDQAIAQDAGRSVSDIFRVDGEAAFRALERARFEAELADPTPRVVALGGGALLDRPLRLRAARAGCLVRLHAAVETIARRGADGSRPLLVGGDAEAKARLLLAQREEGYAEAHATIETDDRTPDEVADRVLHAARQDDVLVALGPRSYVVRVTRGGEALSDLLRALHATRVFVLTDSNLAPLVGSDIQRQCGASLAGFLAVPAGEGSKTVEGLASVWSAMAAAGLDRRSVLVAVGGGVITDLGGFAASTWMRGIRWVSVPTSLLGMVDAGIGGKTAIDLGGAKNVVGTFHQPAAVLEDVERAATEPDRAFASGLAEVVKTALVGDPSLLELLEGADPRQLRQPGDALRAVVRAAAAVKADIVSRDEREGGLRAVLNLGHTFGHAVEAAGGLDELRHGEAVAVGLVAALRVGVSLGVTPADLPPRIEALLRRLGLPVSVSAETVAAALPFLASDKKRVGDIVRFVLVASPGHCVTHELPTARCVELLRDAAHVRP